MLLNDMVALRRAFIGASIAWAGALPLATFVAARPSTSSAIYLLTFAVYAIGAVVCHQRPERSFFLWSHQMPVCARCAGIYIGAALAVIALAALPTVATLVYEWTTGLTPSNAIRAASGLCLGAAVAALIQREVN